MQVYRTGVAHVPWLDPIGMTAFDLASAVVDRAALRSRLLRLSPVEANRQRVAARRRTRFAPPALTCPGPTELVERLRQGSVFVSADPDRVIGGGRLLAELARAGSGAWRWRDGRYLLESEDVLREAPDVYAIGLSESVLDMAEAYLGEPCYYLGCSLKREEIGRGADGTRRWHMDIEDDRIMRLVVYLNEVEDDGGPFQYIEGPRSKLAQRLLGYRSGYVADELMGMIVPGCDWNRITGAACTLIAFDGARTFHRVSRPTGSERFSISFTFVSRHPRQILRPVRLLPESRRRLVANLSPRQAASIPRPRWF